jgi:hypothetical protein
MRNLRIETLPPDRQEINETIMVLKNTKGGLWQNYLVLFRETHV